MMRDDEDLAAKVRAAVEAQRAVVQAMHSASTPDWAHLDLSMGQLKALVALATAGDMNVIELAESLKTSKPSASVLVDRRGLPWHMGNIGGRKSTRPPLLLSPPPPRNTSSPLPR